MVDFVFDNLTTTSPTIHELAPAVQAIKLHKPLWHVSSEFIISCEARGHGFFRLDWISYDIEHAIFFKRKYLQTPSPVTIALVALRRIPSFAEKTHSVVLDVHLPL